MTQNTGPQMAQIRQIHVRQIHGFRKLERLRQS